MTRAYWRLAQAVAEYHFCLDHSGRLGRIKPAGAEPASLRLARASAAAVLRQAELEATSAQCELARLMRLAPGAALPLPADPPHVGPYRTNFQELFAGRTPPEPAALMERLLPIRREAVDAQAAAVLAAEDVLAAAGEQPTSDVAVITACSQELLRQQRAMMHTVCDYNRNIAEYGLTVAGPATSPQALVAMLIGPAQPGSEPAVARNVRPVASRRADRQPDAATVVRHADAWPRRATPGRRTNRPWRRRATECGPPAAMSRPWPRRATGFSRWARTSRRWRRRKRSPTRSRPASRTSRWCPSSNPPGRLPRLSRGRPISR